MASCIEFYWSIPQILLLQEYTIKIKTLVIILQMMYTSNDYTTKICTCFSRIHSWPLSATISWPRLSRAKATWGQSRGLRYSRPRMKSPNSSDFFYRAIYNKFAFINHWIQERMGKVMVGMQRDDIESNNHNHGFLHHSLWAMQRPLFLASRRNSAQRCAPKWCSLLTMRLTLKRKLSEAKSSMQMIFHHAKWWPPWNFKAVHQAFCP